MIEWFIDRRGYLISSEGRRLIIQELEPYGSPILGFDPKDPEDKDEIHAAIVDALNAWERRVHDALRRKP